MRSRFAPRGRPQAKRHWQRHRVEARVEVGLRRFLDLHAMVAQRRRHRLERLAAVRAHPGAAAVVLVVARVHQAAEAAVPKRPPKVSSVTLGAMMILHSQI